MANKTECSDETTSGCFTKNIEDISVELIEDRSTKIPHCRICHNSNLITIFDLGSHALGSRFPASDEPNPMEAPLVLVKCDDSGNKSHCDTTCGLLQLSHDVSPDELYLQHYGYRSGLNQTMISHLNGLVSDVESKVTLENEDIVLDIGSNDCTLLKAYSNGRKLTRVGIDPTGTQFRQYYPVNVYLIPTFFSADAFKEVFDDKKVKVVTTVSMFYDLPDPIKFAADIKAILAPDGIWVTEQSYCVTMLERNSFDTICHEHLEYYTLKQLQYIADNVGLKILDVSRNDCNGGSFRVTLGHDDANVINASAINTMKLEEDLLALHTLKPLDEFMSRCEIAKGQLMAFLSAVNSMGFTIYLYGASTKGNTLLQYYGLDNKLITAAAERNPEKYGRRTPKTNIPIISEAEMREQKPDYLLVLPWHFKKEFLERERDFIDNGGSIIFPLPKFEIYDNKKRS